MGSDLRLKGQYGVLRLQLTNSAFSWQFLTVPTRCGRRCGKHALPLSAHDLPQEHPSRPGHPAVAASVVGS